MLKNCEVGSDTRSWLIVPVVFVNVDTRFDKYCLENTHGLTSPEIRYSRLVPYYVQPDEIDMDPTKDDCILSVTVTQSLSIHYY